MPAKNTRAYARLYSAKLREQERDLTIPKRGNQARRKRGLASDIYFLKTYFEQEFYLEFSQNQEEIIKTLSRAIECRGDQALAALRGGGKTIIIECLCIKWINYGILRFPLICAATGADAARMLANIKHRYETNDLLLEDFPEICHPVRELKGATQRANTQTVDGTRTYMKWGADHVVFPTVKGSKASGSVIATRGLDSAVRGLRYNNLRPDLVVIDDPETEKAANREKKIQEGTHRSISHSTLENIIEKDLAGVSGRGRSISRVLLCTIPNRKSLSARFTDPSVKPSWKGRRLKWFEQMPVREDLWERYVYLRQEDMRLDSRTAEEFYLEHRSELDNGLVCNDPHNYDPLARQHSAIQAAYDIVARFGKDTFLCEYQNDPPEEEDVMEDAQITSSTIQKSVIDLERGIVPSDSAKLTGFIDVGKRSCYWSVMSWNQDFSGHVVDYGVKEVWPEGDSEELIERAIFRALMEWKDTITFNNSLDLVLVDTRYMEKAVLSACQHAPTFRPAQGHGTSLGQRSYHAGTPGPDKKVGEHWYLSRKGRMWVVGIDTDYWKDQVHQRFLASGSGSITLFKEEDSRRVPHLAFSHHIVAEKRVNEYVAGKGFRSYWKRINRNNHWLDTTVGNLVAASICGIDIPSIQPRQSVPKRVKTRMTRSLSFAGPGGW